MKSNCCQANVLLVDRSTGHYKCIACRQTCEPYTKQYRDGMFKGMQIMLQTIKDCDEVGMDIADIIQDCKDLIKQYGQQDES